MANKLVTARVSKKGNGKRGKVHHMNIDFAQNGAQAETHYSPADGSMDSPYQEPDKKVFTKAKDLAKHVNDTMASAFAQQAEPDADENGGPSDADTDDE